MGFERVRWSELIDRAHRRLGNSTFFEREEITHYLEEALRVWNLHTHSFRGRERRTVTALWAREAVHPAPHTVSTLIEWPGRFISKSEFDHRILNEVQYRLIEEPNFGQHMTSELWTISEVLELLNHVKDRLLGETQLNLREVRFRLQNHVPRYDLNFMVGEDFCEVVRAAVIDLDGRSHRVDREDEFSLGLYANWPGDYQIPTAWRMPTKTAIELVPAPVSTGSLYLLAKVLGPEITGAGSVLPVPNDWLPYVVWGLLGSLFEKAGPGHDNLRGQYGKLRLAEGILTADYFQRFRPVRVEIDGRELHRASLGEMDRLYPGWHRDLGRPEFWIPVGAMHYTLWPKPEEDMELVIDGMVEAPNGLTPDDFVDLNERHIQHLLDYVEHIAQFKIGSLEFEQSMPLYKSFLEAAEQVRGQGNVLEDLRKYLGADLDMLYAPLKPQPEEKSVNA